MSDEKGDIMRTANVLSNNHRNHKLARISAPAGNLLGRNPSMLAHSEDLGRPYDRSRSGLKYPNLFARSQHSLSSTMPTPVEAGPESNNALIYPFRSRCLP